MTTPFPSELVKVLMAYEKGWSARKKLSEEAGSKTAAAYAEGMASGYLDSAEMLQASLEAMQKEGGE